MRMLNVNVSGPRPCGEPVAPPIKQKIANERQTSQEIKIYSIQSRYVYENKENMDKL
jgi:hypothetical protein